MLRVSSPFQLSKLSKLERFLRYSLLVVKTAAKSDRTSDDDGANY